MVPNGTDFLVFTNYLTADKKSKINAEVSMFMCVYTCVMDQWEDGDGGRRQSCTGSYHTVG